MSVLSKLFCRYRLLFVVCLTVSLVPALSGQARAVNYIGFASMEVPQVSDRVMSIRLKVMTTHLYSMKYASFNRMLAKMRLTNMKPKTLELPDDMGRPQMLNPSEKNYQAIKEFHEKFDGSFDVFLNELGAINNVQAIVFDKSEEEVLMQQKNFRKDPNATIQITLYAYYRDSNSLAMEYIDINQDLMNNFAKLKSVMEGKVISVAEQVLSNQAGLMGVGNENTTELLNETTSDSFVAQVPTSSEW